MVVDRSVKAIDGSGEHIYAAAIMMLIIRTSIMIPLLFLSDSFLIIQIPLFLSFESIILLIPIFP